MGVEDLEQLDVGGGQGDEVSLVLAFQLGGRELAQHGEHLVAHEREDAKRQVMVAQLLAVTQRAAHDPADGDEDADRGQREGRRGADEGEKPP